MGMTDPSPRSPEVLALGGQSGAIERLAEALRNLGVRTEVTRSLAGLRDAFFRCGGHDVLLLGPDLPAHLARAAARSLAEIAPGLRIVAFGEALQRGDVAGPIVRLQGIHPTSRAGVGAVLRVLREL
jgi:hypothetical protein